VAGLISRASADLTEANAADRLRTLVDAGYRSADV
jgi:hypothetical protein